MNTLRRALIAEAMKTRRTLALGMTILAPLVIAVLQIAVPLQHPEYLKNVGRDGAWLMLSKNTLVIWALLMLPLFVTLETTLLSGLDHNQGHWTLLYTLPVPRWAYYAAKVLVALGLIALSNLAPIGWILVDGVVLQAIDPAFGLDGPFPWGPFLAQMALVYLACWLIISLHLWVAMRCKGPVVPLGIGIAATVAVLFVQDSDLASFYPWTMPGLVAAQQAARLSQGWIAALGGGGGALCALLGGWDISRRDVL